MSDIFKFKNVLVLAPHTDDGELGCGGFIAKLIELGSKVTYAAFSTAEESVPEGFPKDISDFYKTYGHTETRHLIRQLIPKSSSQFLLSTI